MAELKATVSITAIEFSKAQFEIKKHKEGVIAFQVIGYTGVEQTPVGDILSGITDKVILLAENIKQIKDLGESLVQISKQMEERELNETEKYAFRIR